jgi:hypothetical protein
MSKELILKELQKRGVNPKVLNSSDIERNKVIDELKKRGIDPSKTLVQPLEKDTLASEGFARIEDISQLPADSDNAISKYLASPKFRRLALEVGGSVLGAMYPPISVARAATFVRPALQKAFSTMSGAGFGEATGAGISQTFDPSFDSEDDIEEIMTDISKDMLRGFASGATGEGAGILLNKSIARVVGKNKKLIEGAEEAIETIENQRKKIIAAGGDEKIYKNKIQDAALTGQLTPGLLQEGQLIDLLENVSELSLVGSGSIRTAREGAETIAASGVDDFVKNFKVAGDNNELGVLFQKVLTDDLNAFKATSKVKYKAVDKALARTNPEAVSILDLKKFADDELKKVGLKGENQEIIKFLNDIKRNKNNLSFANANEIRSDLLEISREYTGKTLGKKKQGLAKQLAQQLTDAMDNAIIPDETMSLYKDANKFYREGAEIFNNKLFTKIIENDPELVYKSIVAAGDRPTLVKKTFNIIDNRIKDVATKNKLKNSIRGQFLEDAISKSQKTIGQYGLELDASKLNNFIQKNMMTTNAMFTKPQLNELQRMVNALAFTQGRLKKRGGLPGAIFIQMKQSGAIMTLAGAGTGAAVGGLPVAASVILAPEVLAKAFTNPKIVRLLTTGFKYDQTQSAAGRTFRQIIAQMSKEGLINDDERDQIYEDIKQGGYK